MKKIITAPIDTEKASSVEEYTKYAFFVNKNANKIEIKDAVEKKFQVHVTSVNTANIFGKPVNRWTRKRASSGRKSNYKKAYVTLGKGESINIYLREKEEEN